MVEYQEQDTSFPYVTIACFALIAMTLTAFPIEYLWKRLFPDFRLLPKHIRRHDVNLLMRVIMGPVIGIAMIYITVKTFQDLNWWFTNRMFVGYWGLIFLMLDIFDLTQKRRFEWHPYVHHIIQTGYVLYYLEWGASGVYNRGFPCLGLIIFSLSHKPMLGLFPLRRVSTNDKLIQSYAKFAFADAIFAIVVGFGVMLGLIIKYQDHLPLASIISQPIMFLFFNGIDLPFYFFIYKCAYPKTVPVEEEEEAKTEDEQATAAKRHSRRGSLMQRITDLEFLDLAVDNRRSSLFGIPFYLDGGDDDY